MIKARHTYVGKLVADLYSGRLMEHAFRQLSFHAEEEKSGLPILLLANHFSWWDGFMQYRLNQHYFHRKLHIMMLEEQLQKNRILNQCGCFSIKKSSRSILESLDYCAEIMQQPDNMLLIFPQGAIESMHTEYIRFESGLGYLLKKLTGEYTVVFNVNLTDYDSCRKPRLELYTRTMPGSEYPTCRELEEQFNLFYKACKQKQTTKR